MRVLLRDLMTPLEQKDDIEIQHNVSKSDDMVLQQLHRLSIALSKDGARDLLSSATTRDNLATEITQRAPLRIKQ